jgi:hypothetical protein
MVLSEMGSDLLHQLADVMVDAATSAAHHVEMVVGMGDLPASGAIDSEMRLSHEVEIFEEGEGSVDRRDVHAGVGLVDPQGDLLGGEMPVGGPQHRPDEPSWAGQAIAIITKQDS